MYAYEASFCCYTATLWCVHSRGVTHYTCYHGMLIVVMLCMPVLIHGFVQCSTTLMLCLCCYDPEFARCLGVMMHAYLHGVMHISYVASYVAWFAWICLAMLTVRHTTHGATTLTNCVVLLSHTPYCYHVSSYPKTALLLSTHAWTMLAVYNLSINPLFKSTYFIRWFNESIICSPSCRWCKTTLIQLASKTIERTLTI